MIKSVKEIASSSNVLAPVFRFREYVRGQEYFNNGRIIDFVTDHNNLYVPVTDSIPEQTTDTELRNGFGFGMPTMPTIPTIPTFDGECHGVKAIADSPAEDPNFMLLVSKGKQGEPGPKGNPGKDGKTPSVFARFDGKQMVFYTMEYVDGVPTTKRIAATNDLTGPAWKPEVINDTIVWRKSKDDEAPKSIPLDELRAKEAPVLLRVNSDNTKREDETSGPANYIQWKYEGEDYWNNLISISELMNLTLAGVTIFPVENEETGKVEYHLGHKEVTKATYDSTETGKRIITEVELGEVLFDAGKIPFPEYTYDYDIAWLKSENCERKREIDAIERELPKFVRSVNGNRPDEEGNVEIEIPDAYTKEESDDRYQPKGNYQPAGDYIKKSDLQFEVRVTEGEGRYLWVTMDGGNSWTKVMEATCACQQVEPCVVNSITLPQNVSGEIGELVCLEAQIDSTGPCEDLEITWISDNQNMPVDENGCVTINEAGEAHITAVAGGKQASTTVIGRAPETTLSVNPTSLSFDAEPTASKTITVTTNANTYNVSANCEWITPTKSGNTITVAAGDNSGAARTCTITITAGDKTKTVSVSQAAYEEPTVPCEVTSVTLNKSTISTTEGGYPETLEATVVSTGECEDITWTTSDDTVIELRAGENNNVEWIYPVGSGTATVTASLGGKSDTCEITVERRYETYTLTINENGGSAEYKADDSPWYSYEQPIVFVENTSVSIRATKEGFTPTFKDADTNATIAIPFTMIKNTSINITWTEVTPDYVPMNDVTIGNKPRNNTITWDCSNSQTHALSVTVDPNDATNHDEITWTSSKENVAWVQGDIQGGEVHIVGPGTTVISAIGTDNQYDSFTLTVKLPAVSSVTLSETEITLNVGDSHQLTIEDYDPECADPDYDWVSTNSNVAIARNGLVEALAEGEAIISPINGIEERCIVTVVPRVQKQYKVEISLDSDEIEVGDTANATATLFESTDGGQTWQETTSTRHPEFNTPDGDGIINVNRQTGVITGSSVGDATVCVYWEDSNLWSGELSDCADISVVQSEQPVECFADGTTFSVEFLNGTDQTELIAGSGISTWPTAILNPANSNAEISWSYTSLPRTGVITIDATTGEITVGNSTGIATITATAHIDGCTDKTATGTVNVVAPQEQSKTVTFQNLSSHSNHDIDITVGSHTYTAQYGGGVVDVTVKESQDATFTVADAHDISDGKIHFASETCDIMFTSTSATGGSISYSRLPDFTKKNQTHNKLIHANN